MPYKDLIKRRESQKRYQGDWYLAHKDEQIARVAARKQRASRFISRVKSLAACKYCGFTHPAALDFHHRDPSEKVAAIAVLPTRGWSLRRIKDEIRKCDIVCANCHRIFHSEVYHDAT